MDDKPELKLDPITTLTIMWAVAWLIVWVINL
jgi:hypothetical protein